MSLEHTVQTVTATRRQWRSWARREPVLAGLDPDGLYREVNSPDPDRRDVLLAALVRLVRDGPHGDVAVPVLLRCLLGGIRRRVARYRGGLDRTEAFAVFVAALVENVQGYDLASRPRFVANGLLSMPTGRLRRAAAVERTWANHGRDVPEPTGAVPETEPDAPAHGTAMLLHAVRVGIVSARDAWLIWATRIDDMPLRHAASSLAMGYEAAQKRRRRAEQRWATWWTEHDPAVPERHDHHERRGRVA